MFHDTSYLKLDDHIAVLLPHATQGASETRMVQHHHPSDLLIIGLCLEDHVPLNIHIDHTDHTLKKADVFYFRPDKAFDLTTLDQSFLYYLINTTVSDHSLWCLASLEAFCQLGELKIRQAPHLMKTCLDEVKAIKRLDSLHFLEHTMLKGQFYNYLTCLLRANRQTICPPLIGGSCHNANCSRLHVAKAKNIMLSHLDQALSVQDLAERLRVSPYILQQSFKDIEGTTVYDFMLDVKMDKGKSHLRETDNAIIVIAQKLGYENPSKFSTIFKRKTGLTPTEYRQQYRV